MYSDFTHWMRTIASAAMMQCHDGIYQGEDGAKRFARETGAALPDFSKDEKDIRDMISSTYSGICVIAYNLKPPINAHVWITEMHKGVQKALDVVPVPMPDNYTPVQQRLDSSPDTYKALWRGEALRREQ